MTGSLSVGGLSRSLIRDRTWNFFMDATVFAFLFAIIYAMVAVARYWFSAPVAAVTISLSPAAIPVYAFYSLVRMIVAYILSLVFAVGYGYFAAYHKRLEGPMLAVLDILQSIPVLSFLPGVMLAMVSLFPSRQLGVEFGSILLIFTGQVWNMAFSFYASLKALPRELMEASRVYRFGKIQRFLQLELPQGAIGLVWNSMVSVAGGWFFLMACEMFVLGKRDFRLPGLGSYLQSAASAGDTTAITWGIAAMIGVVVLIDQLVWRPAIAWSDKFKLEQVESSSVQGSPLLNLLRKSPLLTRLRTSITTPLMERLYSSSAKQRAGRRVAAARIGKKHSWFWADIIALLLILHGVFQGLLVLKGITRADLLITLQSAGATFLRVLAALVIASAVDHPCGRRHRFQPATGANRAATGANCGLGSGYGALPSFVAGLDQPGRRLEHRIHFADAAGHAMVHPV